MRQLVLALAILAGAQAFNLAPSLLSPTRVTRSSLSQQRYAAPRNTRGRVATISMATKTPKIIQGGMGVQVSSWQLAREVARSGELGVISGTAMDMVLLRWMQDGDPGGLYRRALSHFPDQGMVKRFMDKYFVEGGKERSKPYKPLQMWQLDPSQELQEACVLGNFAEVWLAKHNDDNSLVDGVVGINCLTKIQLPTIESLYGAMLADVDYVLMGAGIPMEVPGILDRLAANEDAKLSIDIDGGDPIKHVFSPKKFWAASGQPQLAEKKLLRPSFLPIVSSVTLAQAMLKRATGAGPTKGIQGFIIELPSAGGHNAPPRGFKYDAVQKSHKLSLNERGEPIYGPKDDIDLVKFKQAVGDLPFWLAGYYARPEKLNEVIAMGGAGIQVGTSFAFSKESGLAPEPKQVVLDRVSQGDLSVFTDPVASPTGFPFKVLELEGSLSDKDKYLARPRVCNLGYLRTPYMRDDGKVGYRCASEPVDDWLKKGGDLAATEGRKCLCNSLMANAGLPQVSPFKKEGESERYIEEILITAGDDINQIRRYMKLNKEGVYEYSARDVIDYLLGRFKEEYNDELKLYQDAHMAEDGKVRDELMSKKKDLQGKIADVDEQRAGLAK